MCLVIKSTIPRMKLYVNEGQCLLFVVFVFAFFDHQFYKNNERLNSGVLIQFTSSLIGWNDC